VSKAKELIEFITQPRGHDPGGPVDRPGCPKCGTYIKGYHRGKDRRLCPKCLKDLVKSPQVWGRSATSVFSGEVE